MPGSHSSSWPVLCFTLQGGTMGPKGNLTLHRSVTVKSDTFAIAKQ